MRHQQQDISAAPPLDNDQCSYDFDTILVTKQPGSESKAVDPPRLSYDKKAIYAGNSHWSLKFKELETIETSKIESRDGYNNDNDRGRSSRVSGMGMARIGGGGNARRSEGVVTITLTNRKITLKCTARVNGRSTGGIGADVESFVSGLEGAHAAVLKRKGDKDPYAFEEEDGNNRGKSRGGQSWLSGSTGRRGAAYGKQKRPMVTPASRGGVQEVYLSPSSGSNKRRSSFQSTASDRGVVGEGKKENNDQYRHYDPASHPSVPAPGGSNFVRNNVVVKGEEAYSSPAVRKKLDLPPESPRNATPVKKRGGDGGSGGRMRGGSVRKFGAPLHSVANLLTRTEGHDDDESDALDDGGITRREGGQQKEREDGEVEDKKGGDGGDVTKRQRLQMASSGGGGTPDDEYETDDSDVEFDEDKDDDVATKLSSSSCKKKLKLAIDDLGDEGGDDEKKGSKDEVSKDEATPPESPTDAPKEEELSKTETLSTAQEEVPSSPEGTTTNKASIVKKGPMDYFLAKPQGVGKRGLSPPPHPLDDARKKAGIMAAREKRSAAHALPSPSRSSSFAPSTPPHRTNASRPTPVTKQTQRKSLWERSPNVDNGTTAARRSAFDYDEEGEDELPGYGRNLSYEYHDVNERSPRPYKRSRYFNENVSTEDHETTFQKNKRGGGSGRNGGRQQVDKWGRRRGDLGAPRIGMRQQRQQQSPGLDRYRAGGRNKAVRNPYNIRSPHPSSSTADMALDGRRKLWERKRSWELSPMMPSLYGDNDKEQRWHPSAKKPLVNSIPGIQNLGNTCYLSASLQTLFSIPQFLLDLYKTYETETTQHSGAKKMPLTCALLEIATAIGVLRQEDVPLIDPGEAKKNNKFATVKAANPTALKKQMDALTDKFAGYEQRDAHEFLSDIVDFLHDELAAVPPRPMPPSPARPAAATEEGGGEAADGGGSSNAEEGTPAGEGLMKVPVNEENKNPNESPKPKGASEETKDAVMKGDESVATSQHENGILPTDDYFHLNVRVCLECDSCGYARSKDEMYRHLSVDVGEENAKDPDTWTVERSLRQFFQAEKRELKCEKCDEGKTATQRMQIISRPKALLLHFKRFIVTQEMKGSANGTDGKENNTVAPPPRMEMVLHKNQVSSFPSSNPMSMRRLRCSPVSYHTHVSGKNPSRGFSLNRFISCQE